MARNPSKNRQSARPAQEDVAEMLLKSGACCNASDHTGRWSNAIRVAPLLRVLPIEGSHKTESSLF